MSTPNSSNTGNSGMRGRIVAPSPPAPVPKLPNPEAEPVAAEPVVDRSTLTAAPEGVDQPDESVEIDSKTSDADVVSSTGSMAVATLLSRITGFIRNLLIGAMLGPAIASAFTTANTLPNMITEVVLGSVMTSLVVPVLVRAEREDPDRGAAFIRRLFTLTITLMSVVTVIAVIGAPILTRVQLQADGEVNVNMSTAFAVLLLPQIFFYGLFSLFMAVLNTKEVFRPGAWAPVANNIVAIAVLVVYNLVPGSLNPAAPVSLTDPHIILLGLGTTAGVIVQCLIMLPALKAVGIDLRPLWGLDARLKQFGGMAVAIIVYVAISQLGLIVTNRIASGADAGAPYIYSQHWAILQVPYGIIGVALLTAIMPRLSRSAAAGDDKAVVRDMTLSTKLTFIALIPIIVFLTAFGPEIGNALFAYANFDEASATVIGLTISFSSFTLIPYTLVMLHLRVFYAREEAWTPTFIIAGITATKIVLSMLAPAVSTSPSNVVILLGAANGFGFLAGAVIGAFLLRRKLGPLGLGTVMRTSLWAAAAGLIGLAGALFTRFLLDIAVGGLINSLGSVGYLVSLGLMGIVFVIITGLVLSRSGLPEVQNLGRVLTRIPGMSRILRPDDEKALEVGTPDPQEMSNQLLGQDSFNASPVPPPMSAGVVRGPRLVPGAPVSDGRFRLLADHGSVPGARFWQAEEQSTGNKVALTFIDTTGSSPLAPPTPAEAARTASDVAKRTRKLSELELPGIAENIRILSYRSGCLVVSDWVEGSSLRTVADIAWDPENPSRLDPNAVALALASIGQAAAAANTAGTALGLDNSSRLRIDVDGSAVLAFPGVLPEASMPQDASGLASAIELLTAVSAPEGGDVEPELAQITYDARAVAEESTEDVEAADGDNSPGNDKLRDLARRLRTFGEGETAETTEEEAVAEADAADDEQSVIPRVPGHLSVERESTPEPAAQEGGFGSRGYTRRGAAVVAAIVFAVVLLIAALTTYLTSLVSGDNQQAPVNTDSLQGSQEQSAPRQLPIVQEAESATIWQAPGQLPGADNPQQAEALVDGDTATSWTSDVYPEGFGTKPGIGLMVTTENAVELQHLLVDTPSSGARISVYALPEGTDPAAVTDLSGLPRVLDGSLHSGQNNIELEAASLPAEGVILWISELPEDENFVEVSELAVIGLNAPGTGETAPAPAAE